MDKVKFFYNARLLDPATNLDTRGGVHCVRGKIKDLGTHINAETIPKDVEAIDCQGLCLAPGLVDVRVHLGEPGSEQKETILTASRAAVAGGVTSIVALPDRHSVLDDVSDLEYIARRARETRLAKIHCYGALTRSLEGKEITEIGLLSELGAVAFTNGLNPIDNVQTLCRAMSYASTFGKVVAQYPTEPSLSKGAMNSGEIATRMGLSGIPALAEVMMIERDLRVVEMTGCDYHIAQVTTAEAIKAIRKAKEKGLPITCDTAPHYFTLNEQAVMDYRTFAKVMPPLRSEGDRQAIYEAVADGSIDIIASDHRPQDQESKRLPFATAEFGMVGLETLLPLSLQFVHKDTMSILDLLEKLTINPARRFGLEVGQLAKNKAADFVIFDLEKPHFINPDSFASKSKNSPFSDYPAQGQVVRTIVDAQEVFRLHHKKTNQD